MDTLSVNAALERIDELVGTDIAVFGQLSLDFEGHCISHLPRAERLPESDSGMYTSSIWTRFDLDAIGQREQWLMQFDARNVVVQGSLYRPDPGYEGCGHFCLWPSGLVVRAIRNRKLNATVSGFRASQTRGTIGCNGAAVVAVLAMAESSAAAH